MKKPKFRINLMTCMIVLTVAVSVFMVIKGMSMQPVIAANYDKAEQIRADIEYENQRIKEIDSMVQKAGTDEYIEKVARDKLGMIKTDEIVFIDISGE